ncbi:MBOAT family O-acyltransferase, partial [Helicobacter equorum]|uniref:MBOAT family O-acyltransferase n=1 Tax=Helicobacter equorum TaxID=361872 RepID=UPI0036203B5D
MPLPHVLLPLALSFVTFQQIAFLVDCYTKTKHDIHTPMQSSNPTHHTIDFIDYCLFITFFPQLIAGPIVHHKEMMPQFKRLHTKNTKDVSLNTMCESNCTIAASLPPKITPTTPQSTNCVQDTRILEGTIQSSKDLDCANFIESTNTTIKNNSFYESIAKGLFIFSIGLFKKVCIADSFAVWANAGYSAVQKGQMLNLFESWATSLSYTFELYFDFSGYCDMAIGLGLLFGIVLPRNFNSPYKALSITDFWRRWHITLGRFLKEYVYIPLGGNRNEKYKNALHYVLINKILTLRNLFIVAFLSGIWHGAGWGFIIWGCMHGVAMVVHRIYTWWYEGLESKSKQFLSNTKAFNDMEACGIDTQYTTHPKFHTTSSASVNPHTSPMAKNLTMHQLSSCVSTQQDNHVLCSTTQRYSFARIYLGFMKTKLYTVLCWILTFNFVNIAWVFFRAENIQGAMNLLKGMFGGVIILPKFLESKLGFVHAW